MIRVGTVRGLVARHRILAKTINIQSLQYAKCFSTTCESKFKIAFFGTDEVSLATLKKLHQSLSGEGNHPGLVSSIDVVCPGDRPSGRGQKNQAVPVASFARLHGLNETNVPYGLCVHT